MIANIQTLAIAAVAGVALGAVGGGYTAYGWGKAAMAREAAAERKAAEKIINRTLAERDQARAEVDKVNAAIAAQVRELAAILSADQVERAEAAKRMEAAAVKAAAEAKRAGERALAAREVIQNVADQCARAGVPADVLRVLNDFGSAPMGPVRMPAPEGDH